MEEQVRNLYPEARVLRMDMDTTRKKDAHEKILDAFANGEADVLVGTQMIVKGHDFPGVTLVGVVAADTTLFESDYRASEKTFDLLTQAAGRAGRGDKPGEVVVQTYKPDHYCIDSAAKQDYDLFYEEEKAYRKMLSYPPFSHMMAVFMEAPSDGLSSKLADTLKEEIIKAVNMSDDAVDGNAKGKAVKIIGPCEAGIYRLADKYRRVIYLKHNELEKLTTVKNHVEDYLENMESFKQCYVSFDLDPMKTY